jgi:hypothetical protein
MEPILVLNPGPTYDSKSLQVFRRPPSPVFNPNATKIDFFPRKSAPVDPAPAATAPQAGQAPTQAAFATTASVVKKEGIYEIILERVLRRSARLAAKESKNYFC